MPAPRKATAKIASNCRDTAANADHKPQSDFYIATICRDADRWKWASAEPATERWGALQ